MGRLRARLRFKPGDLVEFRYGGKEFPPAIVVNVNVKKGAWNEYFTYDVFIPDLGIVREVEKRDIKKWKREVGSQMNESQ
jgi:hypothetical protein